MQDAQNHIVGGPDDVRHFCSGIGVCFCPRRFLLSRNFCVQESWALFPPSVSRYYKIIFTSYFGPLFFSQFSQTLTHHLLPLPGHQGRRLVAALRWRRLRPRPSRRRLGRRPTMCTWRPWCRRPCWCWKKSCSKWQLSRKKGIILISQLFYVELICYDLFNGEPIANASPRIMKGHVYFSIRDCKTLRRDWSAIGSRLRQTLVVKNRLCKRRNQHYILMAW